MPSSSGMVKANDDEACLRIAHAQVENKIPARPRWAPQRDAREYRRLRAFPIWGIHIQTKSTFTCGINGVGVGGGVVVLSFADWWTHYPPPNCGLEKTSRLLRWHRPLIKDLFVEC